MRTSCCALASSLPRKVVVAGRCVGRRSKAGTSAASSRAERRGARYAGRGERFERSGRVLVGAERLHRLELGLVRHAAFDRGAERLRGDGQPRRLIGRSSRDARRRPKAISPRFPAPRSGSPARRGRRAARRFVRHSSRRPLQRCAGRLLAARSGRRCDVVDAAVERGERIAEHFCLQFHRGEPVAECRRDSCGFRAWGLDRPWMACSILSSRAEISALKLIRR